MWASAFGAQASFPRTERIERFENAPQFDPLSGWTVSPENTAKFGSYTKLNADGDAHSLKIESGRTTAVLLSPKCDAPIVEYSFMYRGGSRSANKTNTLRILGSDSAEWTEIQPAFSTVCDHEKHWQTNRLDEAAGIVQLKFVFESGTNATTLAVDTLRVVFGEGEPEIAEPDQSACVSVKSLEKGVWTDDFGGLSAISSDMAARPPELAQWQLMKGASSAERILFTTTRTRTVGGVYVFADEQKSPSSYMLGTLATGDYGCAIGVSFKNDGEEPLYSSVLSFDLIQRNCRTRAASYRLEFKVAAEECGIGSTEGWVAVDLPEMPSYTVDAPFEGVEFRTSVGPMKLPVRILPGEVLVLRWRHDAVASGPMLAIDNVRMQFSSDRKGYVLVVQ